MEFRAPTVAAEQKAMALKYLTSSLSDPARGEEAVNRLIRELGCPVDSFPDWHPILTIPNKGSGSQVFGMSDLKTYRECDHTIKFVRGFVTCPYSEDKANKLVEEVNKHDDLSASRLDEPLYAEGTYPVIVEALGVSLEADGTIRSRDALTWFAQHTMRGAEVATVAETWWNIRSLILGAPHGSRSSLFVNQHAGVHMRKILDALNNSGIFGPIKEDSLEMISKKKRDTISENLIRAALSDWNKRDKTFRFELRGEICEANINDTWDDGHELAVRITIGERDLNISGHFYAENDKITHSEPRGKRALAEKFM